MDVVINYLPVGSEMATKWYVEQILDARCALVNCIPVFIARESYWQNRFAEKGVPIIGDDIKSQVGATILHRILTRLFEDRGAKGSCRWMMSKDSFSSRSRIFRYNHQERDTRAIEPPLGTGTERPRGTKVSGSAHSREGEWGARTWTWWLYRKIRDLLEQESFDIIHLHEPLAPHPASLRAGLFHCNHQYLKPLPAFPRP